MLVEWRVSWDVKMKWRELVDMLQSMQDSSTDHEAIREEIRSLPNFPQIYDIDRDEIVLVDTTFRR